MCQYIDAIEVRWVGQRVGAQYLDLAPERRRLGEGLIRVDNTFSSSRAQARQVTGTKVVFDASYRLADQDLSLLYLRPQLFAAGRNQRV